MKRTFSKEFKTKACELVLKDGIKHAMVAEKRQSRNNYSLLISVSDFIFHYSFENPFSLNE